MKIICVDKIKKKFVKEGIEFYLKQLENIDIVEVKQSTMEKEEQELLKKIKQDDYIILCDIIDKQYSTLEFYDLIEKLNNEGKKITFIIGGSNGVTQTIKNRANMKLSFSKMTFPHELFRLMLIEQIYRVYQIKKGSPYHK